MKTRIDHLSGGLQIHSLTAGIDRNSPLVLLHGYPSNAQLWRHCIPLLAEHFNIFAPDLPGHGRSDKPLDVAYDLDFYVNFLKEYLEAVNIEKTHLAVHDLGGFIGLGFASRYPESMDKFIVMDTVPYKEWPKRLIWITHRLQSPLWSRWILLKPMFRKVLKALLVFEPGIITPEVAELYRKPWIESKRSRTAFRRVIAAPPEAINIPRRDLAKITSPTLILWAENDCLLKPEVATSLHQDIPGSELRFIPECGHFLPEEKPEDVAGHMRRFLSPAASHAGDDYH